MQDETKGRTTNTLTLNIAQHPGVSPPEPGIAPVMIDGVPIHAVHFVQITAGVDMLTKCSITFECEVTGTIKGTDVKDILRHSEEK